MQAVRQRQRVGWVCGSSAVACGECWRGDLAVAVACGEKVAAKRCWPRSSGVRPAWWTKIASSAPGGCGSRSGVTVACWIRFVAVAREGDGATVARGGDLAGKSLVRLSCWADSNDVLNVMFPLGGVVEASPLLLTCLPGENLAHGLLGGRRWCILAPFTSLEASLLGVMF